MADNPARKPGQVKRPSLADYAIPLRNANYNLRVIEQASALPWEPTNRPGVSIRIFEAAQTLGARLTLLIHFEPGGSYNLAQHHGGEELLVLEGTLQTGSEHHLPGTYLRSPSGITRRTWSDTGCLLLVKLGEFSVADQAQRCIDTNDNSNWLPGPVDDTEVLPLHMHDTRSVMMIRWLSDTGFRPRLDPQGEEIYVIEGCLSDSDGHYPAGTWIRNPIKVWQSWQATTGTLLYYKNGHFPRQHG